MEFKTLSLYDLQKDYIERHGFVFIGAEPSDKSHCDSISKTLVSKGFTEHEVEFVVELDPKVFAFVYPEGVSFDMPDFIQKSNNLARFVGGCYQIEILHCYLKNN